MRKYLIFLSAIILFSLTIVSVKEPVSVEGSSATTYTFAIDRKGHIVTTQDAYLPDQTIINLGLDSPSDLHFDKDDRLFIADTGNQRILIYDPSVGEVVDEITYTDFVSPKGVFITEDDELYVADSGAEAVFRFDLEGNFIQEYTKPTSVSFETTTFNPKKVAVDNQDNLYIVAEGVFDGIIQMSSSGEFLGYFAQNKVVLTPIQRFQDLIFSDEQLDQLSNRNPVSFTNVYVDKEGIKYSTSIGDDISNIKKHNTNGSSSIDTDFGFDWESLDVYTDENGIIYTVSAEGYIDIFTSDGWFIFGFGSSEDNVDVSGLYSQLISIAVDSEGGIWTLDNDKAFIQSYSATDYSTLIYEALTQYKDGKYDEAIDNWEEVLKLNQLSVIAHNEIGRNLFSRGEYEESMEHFELSGNRFYYSEAYWEVRNVGMQQGLPIFLLSLIVITVVFYSVKFSNRRYGYLSTPIGALKKVAGVRQVDDLLFSFSFFKHPLDGFYDLKRKRRGSYLGATILFALFFIVYLNFTMNKGFIYQFIEAADMDLSAILIGFFSIFALFIFSNYLVTSINDGEGSIGEIYKGVMYSLMPLTIAYAVTTFLSYYLTYNEIVILQLILNAGIIGTAIILFLAVQELHNYTIRETIKSFLLTFLFMIIAGILFAFVQIMGDQLIQFIIGLVQEAYYGIFS